MNYFEEIVSSLTFNDMKVLGYLSDNEADAKFKAIKRESLRTSLEMQLAEFRKSICRLEVTRLVVVDTDQKEHRIYLTSLGRKALFSSLSEEVL